MTTDATDEIAFPPTEPDINPQSVVVATDGSEDADRAVAWAAEQAYGERRPLVVLTAIGAPEVHAITWSGMGTAYSVNPREVLAAGKEVADQAVAIALRVRPGLDVTSIVQVGDPRWILERTSRRVHMVVVGSRGRGAVLSKLLGSVSAAVSREASCPVVVCRPKPAGAGPGRGILVGADGTAESLPVVEFAFRQAALRGVPLTVVHCLWEIERISHEPEMIPAEEPGLDEHRLLLAENLAGMCSKFPEVEVEQQLGRGLAEEVLSEHSADWDLIVVGRHPVDTLRRLLTSAVAIAVVERADTVVCVVPEDAPDAQ